MEQGSIVISAIFSALTEIPGDADIVTAEDGDAFIEIFNKNFVISGGAEGKKDVVRQPQGYAQGPDRQSDTSLPESVTFLGGIEEKFIQETTILLGEAQELPVEDPEEADMSAIIADRVDVPIDTALCSDGDLLTHPPLIPDPNSAKTPLSPNADAEEDLQVQPPLTLAAPAPEKGRQAMAELSPAPVLPLQAGQVLPSAMSKIPKHTPVTAEPLQLQYDLTQPALSRPDIASSDTKEISIPAQLSKLKHAVEIYAAPAPIDDAKFDQITLHHGALRQREIGLFGARISPQKVAQQIATAISHGAVRTDGKVVELLLMPKELGACRFRMVLNGSRLDVDLAVDNPEVLHLMRRQVDFLITELKVAGFNQTSINFSEMKNGDSGFSRLHRDGNATDAEGDANLDPELGRSENAPPQAMAGRLHLKL